MQATYRILTIALCVLSLMVVGCAGHRVSGTLSTYAEQTPELHQTKYGAKMELKLF